MACLVGLSGNIASGKSTVTAGLRRRGFLVLDCDQIAKETNRRGGWGYSRVVESLGEGVLLPTGEIDNVRLGKAVFSDAALRRRLNRATHLPILTILLWQILRAWITGHKVVVIDMPLLFETGAYKFMRLNVLVHTPEDKQLRRLMDRDGSSEADARARMAAQMPSQRKLPLATLVIDNSGSLEQLDKQVDTLAARLHQEANSWRTWLTGPGPLLAALCSFLLLMVRTFRHA